MAKTAVEVLEIGLNIARKVRSLGRLKAKDFLITAFSLDPMNLLLFGKVLLRVV